MARTQRRIPLLYGVVNGAKYAGIVTGAATPILTHTLVCHWCGHMGGTLQSFATASGEKFYYHPNHAPQGAE